MKLHEAIQVTAELLGRPLSDLAVGAMAKRLRGYPPAAIAAALERCSTELRGALTLRDVLDRMPGGHVSADEAWAIASAAYDGGATVVWTDPIAEAFGTVRHMADRVAARMAFREAYERAVGSSREQPVWWASFGGDASRRAGPVADAVAAGRLPSGSEDVCAALPPAGERHLTPREVANLGHLVVQQLSKGVSD